MFFLIFAHCFCTIFYVKTNGADNLDGSSAANAKRTIDSAITAASDNDVIYISEGLYKTNEGLTNSSYGVTINKNGLTLKGGFDLAFSSQNGETIIDGEGLYKRIIQISNPNCTLEKLTILGRTNSGTAASGDGGIMIQGQSCLITNCIVSNNLGFGIYISSSSNRLFDVISIANRQNYTANGCGFYIGQPFNFLKNCKSLYNVLTSTSYQGAGIDISANSNTIEDCQVTGNTGGSGAGIDIYNSTLSNTIKNILVSQNHSDGTNPNGIGCRIAGNLNQISGIFCSNTCTDGFGGGIYCGGNSNFINAVIFSNYAVDEGGGIYFSGIGNIFTGTVSNNTSPLYGGIYFYDSGNTYSAVISNALIADNNTTTSGSSGISIRGGKEVIIQDCTIINNITASPAYDCAVHFVSTALTNCRIISNTMGGTNGSTNTFGILESVAVSNHSLIGNTFLPGRLGFLYKNSTGAITPLPGLDIINTANHTNHDAAAAYGNDIGIPRITALPASCTTDSAFTLTLSISENWGYYSTVSAGGPFIPITPPSVSIPVTASITIFCFSSNVFASSSIGSFTYVITSLVSNTNIFNSTTSLISKAGTWNLSGVSLSPFTSDLASLFPEVTGSYAYIWDAQNQNYTSTGVLSAGKGFWLNPISDGTRSVSGTAAGQFTSIGIKLFPGWNLVSSPYTFSCKYLNIAAEADGKNSETWEAGANKGIVDKRIWGYDSAQETYYITDTLEPWKGYWVWSQAERYLYIKGNDQTNNFRTKRIFAPEINAQDTGSGEWQVQFNFSAGAKKDSLNVLGTDNSALDEIDINDSRKIPSGPANLPRLCIDNILSYSIKAPVTSIKSWKISLENKEPFVNGELSWNTGRVFDCGLFCTLTENGTGKIIETGTSGKLSITGGNSGIKQEYIFTAAKDDYRYILENRIGIRDAKGGSLYRIQNDYLILGFLPQPDTGGTARICTADGRKIWEMEWDDVSAETVIEKKISVKNLRSGPYLLLLTFKNPLTGQRTTTRKMIVLFR